jgi:hypothetical protein
MREAGMSERSQSRITGAALVAALVVLAAWLCLLVWLVFHAGTQETEWNRMLVILSSLEAVAFAAAGALFGTAVQRQRVKDAQSATEQAEGRADMAQRRADANSEDAADGRALATAVKMRVSPSRAGGVERLSPTDQGGEGDAELLRLAERILDRER